MKKRTLEERFAALTKAHADMMAKAEAFMDQLRKESAAAISPAPGIAIVQQVTADFYHVPLAAMSSPSRVVRFAYPRQIAMSLCRELTRHTLEEIGGAFGGRDHGTVTHAHAAVTDRANLDAEYRAKLAELRAMCAHRVRAINEPLLSNTRGQRQALETGAAHG